MSIDREVNALVETYGKQPQALQDRYVKTKGVVELIALQKIKSLLDEEKKNIAMMMNTNPATIKQQREQEIFGRTVEDVAQQLGGILQTAKNQQMTRRRPAPARVRRSDASTRTTTSTTTNAHDAGGRYCWF